MGRRVADCPMWNERIWRAASGLHEDPTEDDVRRDLLPMSSVASASGPPGTRAVARQYEGMARPARRARAAGVSHQD